MKKALAFLIAAAALCGCQTQQQSEFELKYPAEYGGATLVFRPMNTPKSGFSERRFVVPPITDGESLGTLVSQKPVDLIDGNDWRMFVIRVDGGIELFEGFKSFPEPITKLTLWRDQITVNGQTLAAARYEDFVRWQRSNPFQKYLTLEAQIHQIGYPERHENDSDPGFVEFRPGTEFKVTGFSIKDVEGFEIGGSHHALPDPGMQKFSTFDPVKKQRVPIYVPVFQSNILARRGRLQEGTMEVTIDGQVVKFQLTCTGTVGNEVMYVLGKDENGFNLAVNGGEDTIYQLP